MNRALRHSATQTIKSFFFAALIAVCSINIFAQKMNDLGSLVRTGTTEEKRTALQQLRLDHSEAASRLAIPALSDREPIVRATAVAAVVFLPKTEAARVLLPLLSDKDPFVRKETAYAIGEVGDDSAMLGEENYGDIAAALSKALENEKDKEVRSAIVIAMGKAGGLKSISSLVAYLDTPESRKEEFLRRSAVRSVGFIAQTLRSRERKMSYLDRGMSDDDWHTADYSEEFRPFGAAAQLFISFLSDPKETDDVKREAAAALGHIGARSAIPALTAALNSTDPYLAQNSKTALAALTP